MKQTALILALSVGSAAAEAVEGSMFSLLVSGTSYVLDPTNKIMLEVLGIVLTVLLLAALTWMWQNTPGSHIGGEKEASEAVVESNEADVEAPETQPLLKPEVAEVADVEAAEVAEGTCLEDYEELVKKVVQKGSHMIGPKITKGAQIASLLHSRATGFAQKAKTLTTNELIDTAGSVAKALDMEQLMLLLDVDAALTANMPPASVLVAGLMVPVNLAISFWCHVATIVLMLVPVLSLAIYAEVKDFNHACTPIFGLRAWSRTVLGLSLVILLARIGMMSKLKSAQRMMQERSDEMREKLVEAEKKAKDSLNPLDDIEALISSHMTTLQYGVVCEKSTRTSYFNHVIGAGTLLWLISAVWNVYLYAKYLFVPGVVAFADSLKDEPSYCDAWTTACLVKISIILTLMFFFMNALTVFFWLCETSLNMGGVQAKIVNIARAFDSFSPLPIAEFLAKSFLLRGATDTLSANFTNMLVQKSALADELADTQARLEALQAQIDAKNSECDEVKEAMQAQGGSAAAMASSMNAATQSAGEKGAEMIEQARIQAQEIEKRTSEEIEKIIARLSEVMEQAKNSETFKAAQAAANEAAEQAQAAATQASQQAQEAANQAAEQAQQQAKAVMA